MMKPSDEIFGDEKGKLFVGGLSWKTNQESLYKYFDCYGEIVDCVVMFSTRTRKPRGFGFVKFTNEESANKVMRNIPHVIDDKEVDVKLCNPRHLNQGPASKEHMMDRKVFVGGLPASCTSSQLKYIFSQYGKVIEAIVMYDTEQSKSRGFGFVTFGNELEAEKMCKLHFVQIAEKQVECKKAQTKQELQQEFINMADKNYRQVVSNAGDAQMQASFMQQYLMACAQPAAQYLDYGSTNQGNNSRSNYSPIYIPWSLPTIGQTIFQTDNNHLYQYSSEPTSTYVSNHDFYLNYVPVEDENNNKDQVSSANAGGNNIVVGEQKNLAHVVCSSPAVTSSAPSLVSS